MRAVTDLFVLAVTIIAALVGLHFANQTWWRDNSLQSRYEAEVALSQRMDAQQTSNGMQRMLEHNIVACETGAARRALPPEVRLPTLEARLQDARARYRDLCKGANNRTQCDVVPAAERCTFDPVRLSADDKRACHMNQGIVANCVPGANREMRNLCNDARRQFRDHPRTYNNEPNPNINQAETNNPDLHETQWRRVAVCAEVYGVD